jgi:ATP-dependent DNA ligase
LPPDRFVLDGEPVIPGQSFETLQLRLHPAASRAAKLTREFPAWLIVFDLLAFGSSKLTGKPLAERREALEALVKGVGGNKVLVLSKATRSIATARRWLGSEGLDGIMAKPLDQPYRPGERTMRKFKVWHTVDAVLAGYYEDEATGTIDSLLGDDGLLHFVGHSRIYSDAAEMAKLLEPLKGGSGFTGRSPGGKSRWTGKAQKMVRLDPMLVAELSADHISGGQFRHGSRLIRWRPDKAPEDCTMEQIR